MEEIKKVQVGKYTIEKVIGEGGFGIVYKATDTLSNEVVALKQLKVELANTPSYLERFQLESKLMGSLDHANIVKLIEVFEADGRYFLVMHYLPNGSLAEKLKDSSVIKIADAISILRPIADAIDYAHSKNLVHRDIKPSNILFDENNHPVLTDFGLVKSLDTTGLTTTGVTIGTPEYMSPEQILGKELTTATDIYAFGVVAYEMLAGQLPFKGKTTFEIQEGHVHKPLPNICEINESLPEDYSTIFQKVMDKDPDQRYSTAGEFISDLERCLQTNIDLVISPEVKKKVKFAVDENEFDTGIRTLEEYKLENSHPIILEVLDELKRRKEVLAKYDLMTDQIEKLTQEKISLSKDEGWISGSEEASSVINRFIQAENSITDDQSENDDHSSAKKWPGFLVLALIILALIIVIPNDGVKIIGVFLLAILLIIFLTNSVPS